MEEEEETPELSCSIRQALEEYKEAKKPIEERIRIIYVQNRIMNKIKKIKQKDFDINFSEVVYTNSEDNSTISEEDNRINLSSIIEDSEINSSEYKDDVTSTEADKKVPEIQKSSFDTDLESSSDEEIELEENLRNKKRSKSKKLKFVDIEADCDDISSEEGSESEEDLEDLIDNRSDPETDDHYQVYGEKLQKDEEMKLAQIKMELKKQSKLKKKNAKLISLDTQEDNINNIDTEAETNIDLDQIKYSEVLNNINERKPLELLRETIRSSLKDEEEMFFCDENVLKALNKKHKEVDMSKFLKK